MSFTHDLVIVARNHITEEVKAAFWPQTSRDEAVKVIDTWAFAYVLSGAEVAQYGDDLIMVRNDYGTLSMSIEKHDPDSFAD